MIATGIILSLSFHVSLTGEPGQNKLREQDSISKYYKALSGKFQMEGKTTEALVFFKVYESLKDSLRNMERMEDLARLELIYQNQTREQKVALLRNENSLREAGLNQLRYTQYGITGLVMVVFIFMMLVMNRIRLKDNRENLTMRQSLLQSQMNPHFIFNALTNIQSLVMQQDRESSTQYLDRFENLTTRIREHSERELVTLEEEITLLRDYIALQKLRYTDRFAIEFTVDPRVQPGSHYILPMLLQPAVENSIEHGLKYSPEQGVLWISFALDERMDLICEIEDNGIGREKAGEIARQNKGHHQGIASDITKERIERFNRRSKKKIIFEITDKRNSQGEPEGTKVRFLFPNPKGR
jgi:two-component sensor histidine kinase